ncbi:type 1 glutamine amidotransferase family protein [uncultured Acetobacteroides sp.]|uniref:type 1 glutamine amidotransferase family protein n=1 Tax=uncultured Acetobacteroides sp. TaxID=1760811 RepID=UPI0029F46754|nr:type 1 glutamine amidotransferase family protein [uncultured Acetobacteroides sp.]
MKKIVVFLFDGFSDWEIAYLTPEINRSEQFELVYISKDAKPVTSMGGMLVQPSASVADVGLHDLAMLILPGGTTWEKGKNEEVSELVVEAFKRGIPVAAICAATTRLAELGLLDELAHTSNDLGYLKAVVPSYRGEQHYQNEPAVTGKNVITACGSFPIEFSREVFRAIELYDEAKIEKWFQLFKHGIWSE